MPRLPTLARLAALPRLRLPLPSSLRTAKAGLLPVPDPFNSSWEVVMDRLLRAKDPYWLPQVQFGEVGLPGATRPDWLEPIKWIALYLDTPIHHIYGREAHDAYLRAALLAFGYRVVVWDVPTLDFLTRNFNGWYETVINGLGTFHGT